MLRVGHYLFKRAETRHEFEQIHRLNHRTFVQEIPQHGDDGTGRLVDKFHHKNNYWIVLRGDQVIGMLSAHDQPPFSVADRLADPSILSHPSTRPLEVRLLAIEPSERNSMLFFGLMWVLYEDAQARGYTHLYISGFADRAEMYQRLGCVPLGPAVPCGQASFIPMVYTIGAIPEKMRRVKRLWEHHVDKVAGGPVNFVSELKGTAILEAPPLARPTRKKLDELVCLLPGPVTMSRAVQEAFRQPPIYHRGPEFIDRFVKVRHALGQMVGGRDVAILNGSGTLANEVIAATLASQRRGGGSRGILLINGEFGERIARQAARFGLDPRLMTWAWGEPWDLEEIETALAKEPEGSWVWGVHQESSTGVLNDLPGLVKLAKKFGQRVCVDCISSLGATPLDLSEVYLASGASGKSLGSYAGASLIFADREALSGLDRPSIPSYFDLYSALVNEGPCYTFPSPTLLALEAALVDFATPLQAQAIHARYHEMGVRVRQHLRRLGLPPLAREEHASPVITSFAPPAGETGQSFVNQVQSWGFAIGGESGYLSCRRMVQIATMGAVRWEAVAPLFDHLEPYLAKKSFFAGV